LNCPPGSSRNISGRRLDSVYGWSSGSVRHLSSGCRRLGFPVLLWKSIKCSLELLNFSKAKQLRSSVLPLEMAQATSNIHDLVHFEWLVGVKAS
jgi:hypothetical protein